MKFSFTLCALILVVAGLLGWRESRQISGKRALNAKLMQEAAAIPGDDARPPDVLNRRTDDPAMPERVKTLALDYFALFRDFGDDPASASGEEFTRRQAEIKSRLEALDPSAIRQFMDECGRNPELNLQIKRDLNGYVRTVFIPKYPLEMARMMSRSPELFGMDGRSVPEGYIQDPFQHLVYYWSWEKKDIRTVFQCLAEAPPEFQSKYISGALEYYAYSAPKRTELLEEMRAFASTPEQVELVNRQLSALVFGRGEAKATFIEVSDWLESADLSSDELAAATQDLEKNVRVGETDRWLDWLAKSGVPDEVSKARAFQLAAEWTEKDYLAVGRWLLRASDSPEKTAVASAYAVKAYPYDPEGAMQWLETVPEGPDRTRALEAIYQNMPQENDAENPDLGEAL